MTTTDEHTLEQDDVPGAIEAADAAMRRIAHRSAICSQDAAMREAVLAYEIALAQLRAENAQRRAEMEHLRSNAGPDSCADVIAQLRSEKEAAANAWDEALTMITDRAVEIQDRYWFTDEIGGRGISVMAALSIIDQNVARVIAAKEAAERERDGLRTNCARYHVDEQVHDELTACGVVTGSWIENGATFTDVCENRRPCDAHPPDAWLIERGRADGAEEALAEVCAERDEAHARAAKWAALGIAMLNELRQDYGPLELPNDDGSKAIRALRARIAGLKFVESDLHREWWLNHGCPVTALYGDDGEMRQCGECRVAPPVDMRAVAEEIARAVYCCWSCHVHRGEDCASPVCRGGAVGEALIANARDRAVLPVLSRHLLRTDRDAEGATK